jgi:hypothetical protein
MPKKNLLSKIAAFGLVVGFGLFLLYGQLSSSDFPRGLYGPPYEDYWDHFDSLNVNRVWNYGWWGNDNLDAYLTALGERGMRAVLRLASEEYSDSTFYLEKYSYGQYQIYEADWTYDYAYHKMEIEGDPEGFYYFSHKDTNEVNDRGERVELPQPGGGSFWAWRCDKDDDSEGIMLIGPRETADGEDALGGYKDQTDYPDRSDSLRAFVTYVKAKADISQCHPDCTVFQLQIKKKKSSTVTILKDTTFFASDFSSEDWQEFEIEYDVPDGPNTEKGYFYVWYRMKWFDNCDFWVDWIKYMDKKRGYWLFYEDSNGRYVYRDSIFQAIAGQCRELEYLRDVGRNSRSMRPDDLLRSSFRAYFVINEFLMQQHNSLAQITPSIVILTESILYGENNKSEDEICRFSR